MSITSNQFIKAVSDRVVDEIWCQVGIQLAAFIVAAIVTAAASSTGPLAPVLGALAYVVVYAIGTSIKAAIDAEKQKHLVRSQTFHNEDYEGKITLSSERAYDEMWGGTLPDITGFSSSGTYTDVQVETDKHLFKGTIVLAKKGIKKTGFCGTQNIPIALNYAMQTRSPIIYSDFDDPRLSWYFFETRRVQSSTGSTTKTYAKDNDYLYMTNTIMYLEDAIAKETDGEYTTIYPYIIYAKGTYIPKFQFTKENANFPLPEFYHEYPIFIDSNAYEDLDKDYYTIYKVFDTESSLDIQLIPEDSVHFLHASVKEIDVYLVEAKDGDMDSNQFIGSYGPEFFDFSIATGILTLDPDFSAFQTTLSLLGLQNPNVDYYYIFEIKIEKYRDITDLTGYTQEEVQHIATMQAVEQAIFEYMYQYTHGCKTQQGLSEMFYTFFVTSISTCITTAITLGIGLAAKALDSIPTISLMSTGQNIGSVATPTFTQSLISYFAARATLGSWQMIKLALSPITETLQEIFVDPYLEIIVSKTVSDLGGDVVWQVFVSALVEGSREGLTGPMSTFLFGQQQSTSSIVDTQHIYNEIQMTEQQIHESNIQETQKLRSVKVEWSSILKTGASLLLGTAMVSIGGPMFFGASLVMSFSAISSFSKSFEIRKSILRESMFGEYVGKYAGYTPAEESDSAWIAWANERKISQVSSIPRSPISATVYEKVKSESDLLGNLVKKSIKEKINEFIERLQELSQTLQEKSETIIEEKHNNPLLDNRITNVYYYFDKYGIERPSDISMRAGGDKNLPLPDDALKRLISSKLSEQQIIDIISMQDKSLTEHHIRVLLEIFYKKECNNAKSFKDAKINLINEISHDINLLNSIRNKKSRGGRISFIEKIFKQFPKDYLGSIEDLSQVLFNDRQGLDKFLKDGGKYPTPHILYEMEQNIRRIANNKLRTALLAEIFSYRSKHKGIYLHEQNPFEKGVTMMFENLLGVRLYEYKAGTLEWLRNRHGDYMDLDGYVEVRIGDKICKIAFENNIHESHQNDQKTIENDQDKIKRCRENRVLLIVLTKNIIEDGDPQAYIREQIEKFIKAKLPDKLPLSIDYILKRIKLGDYHLL
ncbi:MAG: hypothetical protein ACFFA3_17370 [Promethearchaeota archaeon]